MELKLSVLSKADQSKREARCELVDRVVLGRTLESLIPLDGPGVSREHLAFERDGESVYVIDQSSNWSSVNGERIAKARRHRVEPGDVIEVPGYEIHFQLVGAAAPPSDSAAVVAPEHMAAAVDTSRATSVEAPAKGGMLAPVSAMLATFSGLEKFVVLVDLVAIALLVLYMTA